MPQMIWIVFQGKYGRNADVNVFTTYSPITISGIYLLLSYWHDA